MDLPRPSEIRIDEVTGAMLQDLNDLAHQVNEIRPLHEEILRQVKDELIGERVFNSNAIEGSTLTIRETRLILQSKTYLDVRKETGSSRGSEPRRSREQDRATPRIRGGLARRVKPFRSPRSSHEGVSDPIAGVLRNRDVMIMGAKQQPPGSHDVAALVDRFFAHLREVEQDDQRIGSGNLGTLGNSSYPSFRRWKRPAGKALARYAPAAGPIHRCYHPAPGS